MSERVRFSYWLHIRQGGGSASTLVTAVGADPGVGLRVHGDSAESYPVGVVELPQGPRGTSTDTSEYVPMSLSTLIT